MEVKIISACVLVDIDGRILIGKRPEGSVLAGLWEYPGGKLEPGETPEECLIRELEEELAINVTQSCLSPLTFASHSYPNFHLLMPLFVCRKWEGSVSALVHSDLRWVWPKDLGDFDMPPADEPISAFLRDYL
jgi:8-oxo-dGTP diphosphatase